ncbi:hypothetical protein Tco_0843250 [Tanacetum coccineum]|uniref:Uncharacterized protein n=1 Tax=Tanacetum coccineum TaxID=301880 RepID=A0ABQ5B4V6_9ASTR
MNQEQIQQAARDEALVPSADRIKINYTNMRIDPTMTQKEETYKVILDIIKNSACYNAFLVIADVLKIYMQQFWNIVKKVKKSSFYEFDLDDKKCRVDAKLFRKILDISPRFHNKDFIIPPSKESMITFLYELGYKDVVAFIVPISMGKTVINILSRIVVAATAYYIWLERNGRLFKKKNSSPNQIVNVILSMVRLKLVTFKFKKMSTRSHLLFDQWKIPSYRTVHDGSTRSHTHLDRVCSYRVAAGLRDVRLIIYTMLTDDIKKSEAYKAFIGYSTGLIPPKKSRGKGSQGKKAPVTPKKSLISADDNIIPEPEVAFELGKSISRTEAEIADEARRVHETHEHLVTEKPTSEEDSNESEGEPANRPTGRRRPSEEQLAADTMQAIKASRKVSRSQSHIRDSSKGAGITPEVLDESASIFTTSSEGTGITPGVIDEQDEDDDQSIDLEETDYEDEYVKYEIRDDEYVHEDEYVHDDVDEEMKDAEVAKTRKDDDKVTDAAKVDAEKSEEVKGDNKQAEIEVANVDQAKDTSA